MHGIVKNMQKIKNILINFLIFIISFLMMYGIVEGVLQISNVSPVPIIPSGLYINHDSIGHQFSSNFKGSIKSEDGIWATIQTDELGIWEGPKYSYNNPPILILGDSFTHGSYCCNLQDTYPKIVQTYLKQKNISLTVINAGVPGHETKNEVEFLKIYYNHINSSLVILTFYVGNDILGNLNPNKYEVIDGKLTNPTKHENVPFRNIRESLAKNSAVYRVFTKFLVSTIFKEESYVASKVKYFSISAREVYSKEILETEKSFLDFKKFCNEKNITCVVHIIPDKLQILKDTPVLLKRYNISSIEQDILWPQEHFSKFFKEQNILYYDLTDVFSNVEESEELFLPINGHWSKKGSRLAGEFLGEIIYINYYNGKK
jgi:hypothetical protein